MAKRIISSAVTIRAMLESRMCPFGCRRANASVEGAVAHDSYISIEYRNVGHRDNGYRRIYNHNYSPRSRIPSSSHSPWKA